MTERDLAAWRVICLASVAAVLTLTGAALGCGILGGEATVRDVLLAWASPPVIEAAGWVNHGGTWRVLAPATLVLLAVSRPARGRWWLWGAVLVAAPIISEGWQELVGRPRPHGSALGFPSGHATSAATFAVLVIYCTGRARWLRTGRLLIQTMAALSMIAVGLARIILRAHWPGDVLVGFALGSACAAAAAWWDATHPALEPPTASHGSSPFRSLNPDPAEASSTLKCR